MKHNELLPIKWVDGKPVELKTVKDMKEAIKHPDHDKYAVLCRNCYKKLRGEA
jgi:hypothetical protein